MGLIISCMSEQEAEPTGLTRVFGWREWVLFEGKKKALRAKFDTGARTSSIHAEEVERFQKGDQEWVGFTVSDPKRDSKKKHSVRYICPVERIARIRNADGQLSERIVVDLAFWIGGERWHADFSLNSRHDMINPVLLGRKIIREMGLVDSGRVFLMGKNPKEKPVAPNVGELCDEDDGDDSDGEVSAGD